MLVDFDVMIPLKMSQVLSFKFLFCSFRQYGDVVLDRQYVYKYK